MAGQGWRMLVEQLSVGRCISLPSSAAGGAQAAVYASAAYARIRRQFNMPIGRFEGIEQVLARMAARTYIIDAARSVTAGAIDGGEKPSVPSAMLKYHATEIGRMIANDAMDVHGGKGICLGPNNYLGRGYQIVPVGITVEGANILTRSLIIFGQGAVRCHPFVLQEMNAARNPDREAGVREFDRGTHGARRICDLQCRALAGPGPDARRASPGCRETGATMRYFQHINRYSASFALATDVAMLALGGYLKKKESLSARLGDVLSIDVPGIDGAEAPRESGPRGGGSAAGRMGLPQPAVSGPGTTASVSAQFSQSAAGGIHAAADLSARTHLLRAERPSGPRSIADLIMNPTAARERMSRHIYKTQAANNPLGLLQEALILSTMAESLEKRIRVDGVKTGRITALDLPGQISQAVALEHPERSRSRRAARLRCQGVPPHRCR